MKIIASTALLLGGIGPVTLAQGAANTQTTGRAAEPAAVTEELQEVTVTGSRIIANGNDSPTPVTIVTTEDLARVAPTTIADSLNSLPVFSGSKTQDSNVIGVGIFGGGNPSANSVNLRNLGLTDTLVLINGQRPSPTLQLGNFDVDMIPDMLVQRVDVATGGASAVYGSDALAGVVNYIYDTKFNGVKATAQYQTSSRSDNRGYKLGIAGGTSLLGGRMHLEGSIGRYDTDGVLDRISRPGWAFRGLTGLGTAATPYVLLDNLRDANRSFGGLITSASSPLRGYTFNTNGVLTPFVHGTATGTNTIEVGGDGTYGNSSLVAPEAMNQFFGRADYDFTDSLRGHLQAIYTDKKDFQLGGGFNLSNSTFSTTNAFLSPTVQSQLSAGGVTTFTLSKLFPQSNFPSLKSFAQEQLTQIDAGLDGKLGKYDWGVTLNYGRSVLYNVQNNNIDQQKLAASLDAVFNSAGQVVCRSTIQTPATNVGCVPLNPFGPSAASGDAVRYVTANTPYTMVYHLYDANAQITGELFNTWAGAVRGALSAEWRRVELVATSGMPASLLEDCTSLRFNCSATTGVWLNNYADAPKMKLDVREAAVEFGVPLLADKPLARAVNLNLAARTVSYSTVGNYVPYKVGPEWKITDTLRLRGTYSRDISAPPVYMLFQPLSTTLQNVQDQLTLQTYQVPSYNLGNAGLKAQVGVTKTLGLVWQPAGSGFSVSTDYYRILVRDAIIRVNVFQAQYQTACYVTGGTSPYCKQIIRPSFTDTSPSNRVTAWLSNFQNIATQETWGNDLELNYTGQVNSRRYNLRLLASYQPHIVYTQPGNDTYDMGGVVNGPTPLTASPSIRTTFFGTLRLTDSLSIGVVERWRNAMKMTGNVTGVYAGNVFIPNRVAAIAYTDLNVNFMAGPGKQYEFFLNVKNIFDTPPPPATLTINQTGPGAGYAAGDDPIGTRFTLGVRAKF